MNNFISLVPLLLLAFASSASASTVTVILQQGAGGYTGCSDRELRNTEGNFGEGPDSGLLVVSEL